MNKMNIVPLKLKMKEFYALSIFLKNRFKSKIKHFLLHNKSNNTYRVDRKEIINFLEELRINKGTEEINFIGSGRSALNAIDNLNNDNLVIGGNFTCLLPIYHHLYFTEWCGEKHKKIIPKIKEIYLTRSKYIGLLIMKNLTCKYNNLPFDSNYSVSNKYLYEASMPIVTERQLESFIKKSTNKKNKFICQSTSSTITAIFLAYLSGFKKINLYGVDFGGGYFWDLEEFKNSSKDIMPMPDNPIRGYKYGSVNLYPKPSSTFEHATESANVPVSRIIELLKEKFKKDGFIIENLSNL